MEAIVAKRLYYSGSVQGVGFRFTARALGNSIGVSGFVKNLADGRVEVLVEGEESKVREFTASIAEEFAGYIRSVDEVKEEPSGRKGSFRIAF